MEHALVPDNSVLVIRNPSKGTKAYQERIYYDELYVTALSQKEVVSFYQARKLSCEKYTSPKIKYKSLIWHCRGYIDKNNFLNVKLMSQEDILRDIEQAQADGEIPSDFPLIPARTDPSGQTVLVATVSQ